MTFQGTTETCADPSAGASELSSDHRLRRATVLVTGARGFIGRHLVRRLLMEGALIHATTRAAPVEQRGVRWWQLDLSDAERTADVVRQVRPDVIIHLASRAQGTRSLELVLPMINDNLLSAVNVMNAAATVPGCRVVLAGSLEEHGDIGADTAGGSPYAASKVAASAFAALFRDLSDLPVVVLRLAMVYGPDDPHRHRLVPYVVDSLLRGVGPQLSSGCRRIDWVYVDDVVDAVLAAATVPAALGRVLDVGSGVSVSIRWAVSLIVEATGTSAVPVFGALPDRIGDRDLVSDPTPASRHLGWKAKTGLRTGIEHTVAWHAEHRAFSSSAG
ncbi:NAD-dependent epimerase/dehydratase family protein [Pseudonocardia kunmingensis]|uniref:Nucleoside-diphosphate-sugar epimerase n=1 Tax=Pseudonocardia kunmingensis TaxID=630975 RepID=A0A543DKW3_9PSEU|nr:NAD(P)-dependent oxidoreductase [Pseudonocardia kunmingensis]TQM09952.1 nucleoside-diphosphate-sugar epimerase [Pseudonocardia kunmingensis]